MTTCQHSAKRAFAALLIASHLPWYLPTVQAQDANNILGLPAVPQNPALAASSGKKAAPPAGTGKPGEAEIKSVLSGNLKLASFYPEGQIIVRVTSDKTFAGDTARGQALQAARLVQRDVRIACSKLCKPAPMPAPTLQPDNTLTFDIVVSGYEGVMSSTDMINLVSGKRVGPAAKPP